MSKKALCVPRLVFDSSELQKLDGSVNSSIYFNRLERWGQEQYLLERFEGAKCEEDASLLQVLPQIVAVNSKNNTVFMYKRGEAGGEARLHGLCSLTLGGHIEIMPEGNAITPAFIVQEAARELLEEIGYDMSYSQAQQLVRKGAFRMLYAPVTPVDEVHLAVLMTVDVTGTAFYEQHEEGHIDNGQWLTLLQIEDMVLRGEIQLETWSHVVFIELVKAFEETGTLTL